MRYLLLPLLLIALPVQAEVYRWVDADGHVHYGDKAPTPGAKPAELPPLQFIAGGATTGTAALLASSKTTPAPAAETVALSIVSPTPDQTLRGTDRKLVVAISLQKPLPEGAGLVYLLDGNARTSKPVHDLSYTHLVAVAVVDGAGRELGRAAPVLVHIQQPGK
jgi:hypothetical protein